VYYATNCVNSPNSFCYICREVTFSTRKRPLTPMLKQSYECYVSCKVGDQDKKWAPHVCCISFATMLCEWLNKKGRSVPFALPMVWREPTDHLTDCYFCIVPALRHKITKKKKGDCQLSKYFVCYSTGTPYWRPPCSSTTAAVYFRFRWWAYLKPGEDTSTFNIYGCWFYCWSSI
jgi:hypothetical protein